jgi:radical SAM protein with 4Fe4S-binding SPASM domain
MNINRHEINSFIDPWIDVADQIAIQEYRSPSRFVEDVEYRHLATTNLAPDYSCTQPWERLTIKGNGAMLPCGSNQNYRLQMGTFPESSIHKIWNSEVYKNLRQAMKNGTWRDNPVCKICLDDLLHN